LQSMLISSWNLLQESSGYPSWVQSETDKDMYIEDYRRAEGIALDKPSISKNPGQRTLANLKLMSMWGKWAQNQKKTQTTLVTSVKELYELLASPATEVTNHIFPNDDVVWVFWKHSEDNIASVTTKLYKNCTSTWVNLGSLPCTVRQTVLSSLKM
jgi:hypothetical protein